MIRLFALIGALLAANPAPPASSSPAPLSDRRRDSCGTDAFKPTLDAKGVTTGYRHRDTGIASSLIVGKAQLDWCQAARNAVVYFYIDDPREPDHTSCPENMSVAVFPSQGKDLKAIFAANQSSYFNPMVTRIEEPQTRQVTVGHGREATELDGVILDPLGRHLRQTMIGYAKDGDFIRVMTGVIEDPGCANQTTVSFLAAFPWP